MPKLTDAEMGERVLELIGKSDLIVVHTRSEITNTYRVEPNPVVFVWKANSTEQLGALVRELYRQLSLESSVPEIIE